MLSDQEHDRFAVFDGVFGLGKLGVRATESDRNKNKANQNL
jgi:hypothetical protein